MAAVPGYISAFMLDRGLPAAVISVILAVNLLFSFLGSLFWGRRIDITQNHRAHFLMGIASFFVLNLAIYPLGSHPLAMGALYAAHGFLVGFGATCLDSWVLASCPGNSSLGARARTFATLSYAATMLATGLLIGRMGYIVIMAIMIGMLGICGIVALNTPRAEGMAGMAPAGRSGLSAADLKQLLGNREWTLLLVMAFFTGLAIAPINNLKAVILERVGGDTATLGLDSFIGCMVQAPFLFFSAKIRRMNRKLRLVISTLSPLLYALLVCTAAAPAMIILGTICQNISFGIFYPTMREITEDCVPAKLRTTAHSVIDVSYGSLTGVMAMAASGVLLTAFGLQTMVLLSFAVQLLPFGVAMYNLVSRNPQPAAAPRTAESQKKKTKPVLQNAHSACPQNGFLRGLSRGC